MKTCLFIYNPFSGKGKIKTSEKDIVSRLSTKYKVTTFVSHERGDIHSYILANASRYDLLVISGGDGTLNETVNAVLRLNKKPVLGYIPSGTVNDVARSLKIPKNIKRAVDIILEGNVFYHDVFKMNDRYGIYVCCSGLFTETSYATSRNAKEKFGKLAYFFHGIKKIFSTPSVNLTLENKDGTLSGKYAILLILNSRSAGGFVINKKAKLDDGLVDIVLIKSKKDKVPLSAVFRLAKVFLGGVPKKSTENIRVLKLASFTLTTTDDTIINLDGEKISKGSFEFKVLRQALPILVSEKFLNRK